MRYDEINKCLLTSLTMKKKFFFFVHTFLCVDIDCEI